jgi:hypothetical protein
MYGITGGTGIQIKVVRIDLSVVYSFVQWVDEYEDFHVLINSYYDRRNEWFQNHLKAYVGLSFDFPVFPEK